MENDPIPSSADVRRLLEGMPLSDLRLLATRAGVPFGTLHKIAAGVTTNPGIETVRRFYALAAAPRAAANDSHIGAANG